MRAAQSRRPADNHRAAPLLIARNPHGRRTPPTCQAPHVVQHERSSYANTHAAPPRRGNPTSEPEPPRSRACQPIGDENDGAALLVTDGPNPLAKPLDVARARALSVSVLSPRRPAYGGAMEAFGGVIGRYHWESTPWWPEGRRPGRAPTSSCRARRRRLRPARLLRLRHRHAQLRRACRRTACATPTSTPPRCARRPGPAC